MNTPGLRALCNNLNKDVEVAGRVDAAVKSVRHNAWRGHPAKESVIKAVLYRELKDPNEVERIFMIIKGQMGY